MEIPFPPQNDIYTLGFDKSLGRDIPDNATGVVYDSINDTQNTASLLSGGNLNLKTLSIGGLVRQVAPGDDIQAAIDAVSREGGGTVQLLAKTYQLAYDILLRSNVAFVGAGRDVTVIDYLGRSFGVRVEGIASSYLQNWQIRDLTIQNSNYSAGLKIQHTSKWRVENVRVTGCKQKGISTMDSRYYSFYNCISDLNTGDGFYFDSIANDSNNYAVMNCVADNNGGNGFSLQATNFWLQSEFRFVGCSALSNVGVGYITESTGLITDGVFSSCSADSTVPSWDFDIAGGTRLSLIGCSSGDGGANGLRTQSGCSEVTLVACNMGGNITLDGDVTILGSSSGSASNANTSVVSAIDTFASIVSTTAGSILESKDVRVMTNSSGAGLRLGNVVVYSPSAAGLEVGTTTTNGDKRIFGMALETVANNSRAHFMTTGYTQSLYATNGTASLSIGDFLSAYSHAYYAKKAVAGDTAFAVCLEAPTTGTALIDALLISPRLI